MLDGFAARFPGWDAGFYSLVFQCIPEPVGNRETLHAIAVELVRASAQQCGIKLVDLPSFWAMISALGPAQVAPLRAYVQESDVFAPTCPHCALSLRERVARTGRRFMACPNYPRCQYSPLQALKNTADRLQAAPPQN